MGGGDGETMSAEEVAHDGFEKLLERMAYLRDRGGELDPEERREQATRTALEMARLLGEDGDGDEEGELEG